MLLPQAPLNSGSFAKLASEALKTSQAVPSKLPQQLATPRGYDLSDPSDTSGRTPNLVVFYNADQSKCISLSQDELEDFERDTGEVTDSADIQSDEYFNQLQEWLTDNAGLFDISKNKRKGQVADVYDIWEETYKPIRNTIDTNSAFDGTMFETYGAELEFVQKQPKQNIWTLVSHEGGESIIPGFNTLDRMGYFVAQRPWNNKNEVVTLDGPDVTASLKRKAQTSGDVEMYQSQNEENSGIVPHSYAPQPSVDLVPVGQPKGTIAVKVTTSSGDSWTTSFNGSLDDAKGYFLNKEFNVGTGPEDNMQKVTSVELAS